MAYLEKKLKLGSGAKKNYLGRSSRSLTREIIPRAIFSYPHEISTIPFCVYVSHLFLMRAKQGFSSYLTWPGLLSRQAHCPVLLTIEKGDGVNGAVETV